MPVRKPQEIESSLSRKGFRREKGGRHPLYRLWVDGKKTGINTPVSGKEEYSGDLLKFMRMELRLDTTKELLALIDCPMSGPDYLQRLRGKGLRLGLPS